MKTITDGKAGEQPSSKKQASLRWREYARFWNAEEVENGRRMIATSFPHAVTCSLALNQLRGKQLEGSCLVDAASELTAEILSKAKGSPKEVAEALNDMMAYASAHIMWVVGGLRLFRLDSSAMERFEAMQDAAAPPEYNLDSPELRWYPVNRDKDGHDNAASFGVIMPDECSIAWFVVQAVKFRDGTSHIDLVSCSMSGIYSERLLSGAAQLDTLKERWSECHGVTRAVHTLMGLLTSATEEDVVVMASKPPVRIPVPPGVRGRVRRFLSGMLYSERVLYITSSGLRRVCRVGQSGSVAAKSHGAPALHAVRDYVRLAAMLETTAVRKGYAIQGRIDDRMVVAFVPVRRHHRGQGIPKPQVKVTGGAK